VRKRNPNTPSFFVACSFIDLVAEGKSSALIGFAVLAFSTLQEELEEQEEGETREKVKDGGRYLQSK